MQKSNLSFGYYYESYCMGQKPLIEAVEFEKYKRFAEEYLEIICSSLPLPDCDSVKDCICTMAERLFTEQKRCGIRSENTDGYSVTFAEQPSIRKQLFDIASVYLGKKGLIYAGVE